MKSLMILLISLAIALSACSAFQTGGEELTIPSKWSLVSYGKVGAGAPLVEGSKVTLEFSEKNQLGGTAGCNSYGAEYSLSGKTLAVTQVVSTLMACADDTVMQQESQYLSALQGATTLEISGDTLTISYDNGQSQLLFSKQ